MAGKRAGLKHSANGDDETTRSGLFMEAVRIIKEMRSATNGEYPKFAIWENVPGAFSSNKGEDFRVVLEELVKICEPEAPPIPSPGKTGWPYADCIVGDGWSLAWRVFDSQHWGVAQRRRRVYALLDLTGERAEKVLFEREGLRGYFTESGTPWQRTAGNPQGRSEADNPESGITAHGTIAVDQGGGKSSANFYEELAPTLTCTHAGEPAIAYTVQPTFIIDNIGGQAEYGKESQVNGTLRAGALGAICYDARGNGNGNTVNTITGDHNNRITDYTSVVVYDGSNITCPTNAANPQPGDPCHTLSTDSRNHLVYCLQGNGIDRADTAGCNGKGWAEDVCYTLNTIDRPAVSYAADVGLFTSFENTSPSLLARMHKDPHIVGYEEEPEYIVRRLTPTECARLQGFPDRWGDIPQKDTLTDEEYSFWLKVRNTHAAINGRATKEYTKEQLLKWYNKLHSDSSEYKMWGNGIALPNALYVMQGIAEVIHQ